MENFAKEAIKEHKAEIKYLTVTEYLKNLPKRLVALRKAEDGNNRRFNAKMSGPQIAEFLGMTKQNYWKIEEGIQPLLAEHAIKLSLLYGCSLDYIVTGREHPMVGEIKKQLEDERKLRKLADMEVDSLKRETEKLKDKLKVKK